MKKILFFLFSISLLALMGSQTLKTYQSDTNPERYVRFRIKNAGFMVDGHFAEFKSEVRYDKAKPENSHFKGTIEVKSIDTGNGARDKHLRKADYFDAAKFPQMQFVSSSVEAAGFQKLKVKGDLTIRDKTSPVSLEVYVSEKNGQHSFVTDLKINRLDYGVGGSSWTLSDEVLISLKVQD